MTKEIKYKNIILLGPPGSGKGTISNLLIKQYNLSYFSTGETFREEIQNDGPLKQKIHSYLSEGKLVPDEITNILVKNKIEKLLNENSGIILDGYPRNINQAEFLESFFNIDIVLYLDVPEEVIIDRILGRMNCPKCNRIYNKRILAPKIEGICDDDGTKLEQREDDNIDTIKNRLKTYNESTSPLINFYKDKDCLMILKGDEIMKDIEERFVLKK